MGIGPYVKQCRERLGITQAELARRTGFSATYHSRLEKGDIVLPTPSTMSILSRELKVGLSDLYATTPAASPPKGKGTTSLADVLRIVELNPNLRHKLDVLRKNMNENAWQNLRAQIAALTAAVLQESLTLIETVQSKAA